jgi:hypothetical protein
MDTIRSTAVLAAIGAIAFSVFFFLSTFVFADLMMSLWVGLFGAAFITLYVLVAGPAPLRRLRI